MDNLSKRLDVIEFEFRHLADRIVNGQLERWIPGIAASPTHVAHINRYMWVSRFVQDKEVLDLACGAGYGAVCLIKDGNAKSVLGGDVSEESIRYCVAKHGVGDRIDFERIDAELMDLSRTFDAIVSFETIEHLADPGAFLSNAIRHLKSGGEFFISTPISTQVFDSSPANSYHVREWGAEKFIEFIEEHGLVVLGVYVQPFSTKRRRKFHQRVISRFKRLVGIDHRPNTFKDFSILESSRGTELSGWQKKVTRGSVGAYLILRTTKK
jgi:2-polyprenyl-3-methyl-5-hydroxy-6-metoxy-1,4-benzoquinol methylase